jgi:multiple sugar transport system ATP-binding protein
MTMATKIVVLNKGRIEQVGTPLDVYDRPASTFVATFIGSPAMNLLPAKVAGVDGAVRVTGLDFEAELWAGDSPEIEVLLGARPEHLRVLAAGEHSAVGFRALVTNIEQLGHETILYGRADGADICVRRPRSADISVGDEIRLGIELDRLHIFEAASGRRLEWQAAPEPEAAVVPALAV